MIKLGRIHIENFKSFIEPIDFDFSNKDLVLFDGPNGFGKTTVFDAVELCFTGKISRIAKKIDDKSKEDHILKGDNTKPTIIKLELLQNNECIKVIGIFIPANLSGQNLKIANYSNSVERFETERWEDLSIKKKLNIKNLQKLLNNTRLDSTFALFNYIQQEETCHFLKLKEKERHNQISHLFGTTGEKDKFDKLEAIIQKINNKIQEKNNSFNTKKNELSELSKPVNDSNNIEPPLQSGKIALFSDLSSSTREQLEAYSNNLEGLRWIVNNQTEYKKLHFNFLLEKITTERTAQLKNYIKVGVAEKYREIQNLRKQYTRWKCSKEKEKKYRELIQLYDESPNSLNKNILDNYQAQFPNQFKSYTANINSFNTLIDSNDSLDSLLNKIYEGRKNLLTHYEGHLGKDSVDNLSDIHCPFCGDQKEHWQNLLDEYELQSVRFEEQLGKNVKQLNRITEKLIKELINPLVLKMRRFSLRYRSYLGYDFDEVIKVKNIKQKGDDAKELIKAKIFDEIDFDSMIKVKNWLDSNVVKCETFQDEHLRKISKNYSEKLRLLIDHINDQKKTIHVDIPKDFQSLNSDLRSLNLNFDKGVLHSPININDIDKDAMLLSRLIIQKNSGSYNAKQQELNDLQHKLAKLESKKQQITQIKNIYNKEIKAYEKNVAKHIAIPLFVYSSKILQSRPEGSGVYLITPENSGLKGFVRFSATNTDSHDAWNTMSSGQLAGVVISFMLAMNKVYPSKLSALMIDDPVQTMDEVNMASFVQLMRYEFPNLQILLSTHENKVANYLNYKYKEAGLETYPINMKDERLGFVDS